MQAREETHSMLWTKVRDTTRDRGEVVLVLLISIFSPDTEWLEQHLGEDARKRVETAQAEWAEQAHQYCKQGNSLTYRSRLGEILMTTARIREIIELEELRVHL